MKLSRLPSKIIGVRLGEATFDFISQANASVVAKFVLLGDPSKTERTNIGQVTKRDWSPTTLELLEKLVESMESDALVDLFGDSDGEAPPTSDRVGLSFPPVPVLGGPKPK